MNRTLLKSKHSCEFSAAKKIYFITAMLLSITTTAQSVKTSAVSAAYSTTPTVSFTVSWAANSRGNKSDGKIYNPKIWVFVDYQPIAGDGKKGEWDRAVVTVASASIGSVSYDVSPQQGFWLDASSVGTAALTSKVTVTLDVSGKFNWCAYATDHAPNAASYTGGVYTLKGTKPFYINGLSSPISSNQYAGTINAITDATGCPGCIGRDAPQNSGTCCSGLTLISGYCRNLVADDAVKITGCGGTNNELEVKITNPPSTKFLPAEDCPAGWRPTTRAELKCMWNTTTFRSSVNLVEKKWYRTNDMHTTAYSGSCDCTSTTARWELCFNSSCTGCTGSWPSCRVESSVQCEIAWPASSYDGHSTVVKCVR